MSKREDYDDSVKALHRMIAYIRDEALRLRIGEVAQLLEDAENAVGGFIPAGTSEQDGLWRQGSGGSIVEH